MLIKADMGKAHDRILWSFLQTMLRNFAFHQTWINWVMQCVLRPRLMCYSMDALAALSNLKMELGKETHCRHTHLFFGRAKKKVAIGQNECIQKYCS